MFRNLAVLLVALVACGTRAAPGAAHPEFDHALQEAGARRSAVLVDFHAPWCYSCYFMSRHVLNGPEWDAVRRRAVILEQDADAPQGAALKERLGVKALPSYVVLDADGREIGRILGEQTRADFYAALNRLLDRGSALDTIAERVSDGSDVAVAAGRETLSSYHARFDAGGGLNWFAGLPGSARAALAADAAAARWLARLRFLDAAQRDDAAACVATGQAVLSGMLGCARAYELDRYLGCASGQSQAQALLAAQQPAIERLLEDGVFSAQPCADERSVVLVAADLHHALNEPAAERALLARAIAALEPRIDSRLGQDRNLADNLRVYRERLAQRTGDYRPLDALLLRLIDLYPDDYVYSFRHGRSLLARGQAATALPFLERAAQRAYGINRLRVAEQRVKALQALGRGAEARRVVAETLKANGPWFPDAAATLKALPGS